MSGRKPGCPKTLCLKNKEGRKLTVTFRIYRPGDEAGMIACIRDEYGNTYFRKDFYHPAYLRKEAQNGHITFLAAQTAAGEIAGMMILKGSAPEAGMCEIASQIFRKKYRGYGMAMPFFEYGMEILLSRDYSAACCLSVVFHDTTQRLLQRMGFRATGFVLNVFDTEHMIHSYKNGRNTKNSQGIQIRAVGKQDAGAVYLPAEHREFCSRIYENLGVRYRLAEKDEFERQKQPLLCEMFYEQDDVQKNLKIRISGIGLDLSRRIAALHEKFPLKGKQTSNIFLTVSDKNAVWAYRVLTEMGYFFTGLMPLCGGKEYMVLHRQGEVGFYLEDYMLSEEFSKAAAYIEMHRNHSREMERMPDGVVKNFRKAYERCEE